MSEPTEEPAQWDLPPLPGFERPTRPPPEPEGEEDEETPTVDPADPALPFPAEEEEDD